MTTNQLLNFIYYLFFGVILVPIGIGLRYWKQLTPANRWLIGLLLALLLLEIAATVLRFNRVRNHFIYYFQTIAVLWCGTFFFKEAADWSDRVLGVAIVLSIAVPVEVWGWVGFNHINSTSLALSRLVLTLYAFLCLKRRFDQADVESLRKSPYFYPYIGFFVYGFFSTTTLYFKNYFIETSLDLYYFFDTLAVIMSAVAFGLFALGFTQQTKQSLVS